MGTAVVHLMVVVLLTLASCFEFSEWRKRRRHHNRQLRPPKRVMVQRPR